MIHLFIVSDQSQLFYERYLLAADTKAENIQRHGKLLNDGAKLLANLLK